MDVASHDTGQPPNNLPPLRAPPPPSDPPTPGTFPIQESSGQWMSKPVRHGMGGDVRQNGGGRAMLEESHWYGTIGPVGYGERGGYPHVGTMEDLSIPASVARRLASGDPRGSSNMGSG